MATESSKMIDRASGGHKDDPEVIRAEIRATREDMTDTVRALQEKLNPQRIKDEAMLSVRSATIGRVEDAAEDARWKVKGAGNDVFETIKRNPAPALLAAVGLGWLLMEGRSQSGEREMRRAEKERGRSGGRSYYADERYGRGNADYTYDEYGRRSVGYGEPRMREFGNEGPGVRDRAGAFASEAGDRVQGAARQASGKVQDVAGQAADKVQDVAGQAADTVQNAAESAMETAGQVVDSARQGVQQVAHQAQYRAERVGTRFGQIMDTNPLVIGAAAIAVGAVLGFAFPTTAKEDEIMGEARDKVMDKAQQAASDTAQKVQSVAQEAASAAKDAAKDAVKDVQEAAKNEAQKQNLTSGSGA